MGKTLQKSILILSTLFLLQGYSAQGDVGINTEKPTENLDVNGTVRVRTLPAKGSIKSINTDAKGDKAPDKQNYNAKYFVVADDNGVLGKSQFKQGTNNSNDVDFNNSNSIFVIRKFKLRDWPSSRNQSKGFDTKMSTEKWVGFMTSTYMHYSFNSVQNTPYSSQNQGKNLAMGVYLKKDEGTWKIVGDAPNLLEQYEVDILFIKKDFVMTSDTRLMDNQP